LFSIGCKMPPVTLRRNGFGCGDSRWSFALQGQSQPSPGGNSCAGLCHIRRGLWRLLRECGNVSPRSGPDQLAMRLLSDSRVKWEATQRFSQLAVGGALGPPMAIPELQGGSNACRNQRRQLRRLPTYDRAFRAYANFGAAFKFEIPKPHINSRRRRHVRCVAMCAQALV
jgi:hypothetical protein